MNSESFIRAAKPLLSVLMLGLMWGWETWKPFQGAGAHRWKHAGRNLAIAILNTIVLAILFGIPIVTVATWASHHHFGLLNWLRWAEPWRTLAAVLLLDFILYCWHRANHVVPFLWRFHRMHHSDDHMDVTTATRFHLGEHVMSVLLRLLLIPLVGFQIQDILIHDAMVIVATQFHHADVSLGGRDRWLMWFIVTPFMHKVHHSRIRRETDSNYSIVFSVWDRLAGTLRLRDDPHSIEFGLPDLDGPQWQTVHGMLSTPFRDADRRATVESDQESE